jgi:HAD superfamily hydrolase (TIGR01509 family)
MASLSLVLLDIDGTLIDSNDAHARSWVDALAVHGYKKSFAEVRPLIGKGGDKVLPELTGIDSESDPGQEISETRKKIFAEEYLPKLRPFPRVRELLERMKRDGLMLVVATSAEKDLSHRLLDVAKIRDLIDEKTTSDDADRSKPDPDIVHAALEEAGKDASRAVMLGDTPYDIEAAARAGVRCIAFRCGGWWKDTDLSDAVAIYDDPADLLAHYEESPLSK